MDAPDLPIITWKPEARERFLADKQDRQRREDLIANMAETPINDVLADYVQSSSFNLSLGRTHVAALIGLAGASPIYQYSSAHAPVALRGLERRGLVEHHVYEGEPPPFGNDSLVWELTIAGRLVVCLLAEAGMITRGVSPTLPPPPPHLPIDKDGD